LQHELATLSIADDRLQHRSPRDFYEGLLIGDGRKVIDYEQPEAAGVFNTAMKGIKDAKKAERERLHTEWPTIPPITRENPAKIDYTPFQVQLGVYHADILRALRGNLPDGVAPERIAQVVDSFAPHSYMIEAFLMQDVFFVRAEGYLADAGRALSSVKTNVSRLRALVEVRRILPTFEDVISTKDLDERAPDFLQAITDQMEYYDLAVTRDTAYHIMVEKHSDPGKRAYAMTKALLRSLGLKFKQGKRLERLKGEATTYSYSVENVTDFHDFLSWRGYQHSSGQEMYDFERNVDKREAVRQLFAPLTPEQRSKALYLRTNNPFITIEEAVYETLTIDSP
jgi:hypothetical protein